MFEFSAYEECSGGLHRAWGEDSCRTMVSRVLPIFVPSPLRQRAYSGGPHLPFRGGRVDAIAAGVPGVPQPQESLDSHTAAFARQGFNQTEMITLIACGHSFGGVQNSAFPQIVPLPDGVSDVSQTFDSTPFTFDNNM